MELSYDFCILSQSPELFHFSRTNLAAMSHSEQAVPPSPHFFPQVWTQLSPDVSRSCLWNPLVLWDSRAMLCKSANSKCGALPLLPALMMLQPGNEFEASLCYTVPGESRLPSRALPPKGQKENSHFWCFLLTFLMLLLPLPIEPSSPLLFPLDCDSRAQTTLVHTCDILVHPRQPYTQQTASKFWSKKSRHNSYVQIACVLVNTHISKQTWENGSNCKVPPSSRKKKGSGQPCGLGFGQVPPSALWLSLVGVQTVLFH